MPSVLRDVLSFSLLPVLATIAGALLAARRPPRPATRSALQHAAAGVVFAAVSVELLPDIIHQRAPLAVAAGFACGIATMLAVRRLVDEQPGRVSGEPARATGLVVAVGVDVLIDGLLIGIGFAAGAREGRMLTLALTFEVLFLGSSTTTTLLAAGASRLRAILTVTMLALTLGAGAALGATLLAGMSGPRLEVVLSFGLAALLFLVTEELLVEAHEVPETPLITAAFFAGFLALLLIDMASGG